MTPRPADPLELIDRLTREQLVAALVRISARLAEPVAPAGNALGHNGDRMLSPAEAALRLGTSRRWVWDHAAELGAVKLSRTAMRIPASSVERVLQARGQRAG